MAPPAVAGEASSPPAEGARLDPVEPGLRYSLRLGGIALFAASRFVVVGIAGYDVPMANVEFISTREGEWRWSLERPGHPLLVSVETFISKGVAERDFIEFADNVEEARERFRAGRGETILTQIPGENQ